MSLSHPAWDAWIEITEGEVYIEDEEGRIPHGMRGLKYGSYNTDVHAVMVASRMGCVD